MGRSMFNLFPHVVVTMLLIISGKVLLASGADISLICSKTNDPALCTRLLEADRSTATASLAKLGEITINMAGNSATVTKIKLQSLIGSETDPHIRTSLTKCNGIYAHAIDTASLAAKNLRKGDYNRLSLEAGLIITDANECEAAFQNTSKPSPLTNENHVLACLGYIISVITDLSGPN